MSLPSLAVRRFHRREIVRALQEHLRGESLSKRHARWYPATPVIWAPVIRHTFSDTYAIDSLYAGLECAAFLKHSLNNRVRRISIPHQLPFRP